MALGPLIILGWPSMGMVRIMVLRNVLLSSRHSCSLAISKNYSNAWDCLSTTVPFTHFGQAILTPFTRPCQERPRTERNSSSLMRKGTALRKLRGICYASKSYIYLEKVTSSTSTLTRQAIVLPQSFTPLTSKLTKGVTWHFSQSSIPLTSGINIRLSHWSV